MDAAMNTRTPSMHHDDEQDNANNAGGEGVETEVHGSARSLDFFFGLLFDRLHDGNSDGRKIGVH
jgi:hypothetical protein